MTYTLANMTLDSLHLGRKKEEKKEIAVLLINAAKVLFKVYTKTHPCRSEFFLFQCRTDVKKGGVGRSRTDSS